ncbi:MAG TPA: hypothetical protein VHV81_14125 [Steroidobacteraceae bacterium]|jgi:hypothetical protein|nr:hypothetical protein [Steroidobacteraceae bacterium]
MTTLLAAGASVLVFCAPGYPGASGDAQPLVDRFAAEVAAAAGWPAGSLTAVYDPTEEGGLDKLAQPDAALTFVPYPFYVQHAAQLHLTPLVQADVAGEGLTERWSLVAKTGSVSSPQSVVAYTLLSVAGYAPEFVRHAALVSWPLPPTVKIEPAAQILTVLRRVASGEQVVALLDQSQSTALPTLPFAADLKIVTQSAELPVAFIAAVGSRLPAARAKELQTALLKLGHGSGDADALGALRLQGFALPQPPHPSP